MIHEALFYLWNYPGTIFTNSNGEEWINSVDLQEFLHPGEKKLLQRIMIAALNYHKLQVFIKAVQAQQIAISEEDVTSWYSKSGLYIKAFCDGIEETLQDYRQKIIETEDILLKNPQLTLTYVLSCVEKFIGLFEALNSMTTLIEKEEIHGCLLVGKLHSYVDCGIEYVSQNITKIIRSVNTIFCHQLCNWIIYGDLVDNSAEFFIGDGNCPDENFLHPEQLKAITKVESEETRDNFKKWKFQKLIVVRKFYLKANMIPLNMSLNTAETILFIGRIVWIIRNDPKRYSNEKRQLTYKRDVWGGKDIEYYKAIQELENAPYNLTLFNMVIEKCRLTLTQYLWEVMVEEAKLLEHLQLIRDYYALGRGELFQEFIIITEEYLKGTSADLTDANLNFMFVDTARKLYNDSDKSYLRFNLSFARHIEKRSSNDMMHPWTYLEIHFDVQWPLHILFHPKVMALYNKLFCFLLKLKKIHIDLHNLWLKHMEGKGKLDATLWTLRNRLMFIVNNLQYYFQVDVIEAEFSIFKNAVQNANQFEDIIRLHSKFLKNLVHKTFILTANETYHQEPKHTLYEIPSLNYQADSKVYQIIVEIMQLCNEFCNTVQKWNSPFGPQEQEELLNIKSRSDSLIEILLELLYKLHLKASGHHLLQLLHHVDFNRWFSKCNTNLNLTN